MDLKNLRVVIENLKSSKCIEVQKGGNGKMTYLIQIILGRE